MPDRSRSLAATDDEAGRATGGGADRGQLSLSAVEAAVGVLLVLGALASFFAGVPAPDRERAALSTTASDAATVLSGENPRHAGATRLAEVARSPAAFDRERDALSRRVAAVLPENVLFEVRTPHGTVGFDPPDDVPMGVATVPTRYGDVTIRVWYA
ncbi:hypothetical protein [Halorubellus sp. PRR65]|uniref:DUF7262 family protein n=1 Tax=Halorubellus sp. PRR65 TaxID=3098148 RepID=UPI002B25C17C|nr:hypothetical protein [Halorubellus sp. PRR65]